MLSLAIVFVWVQCTPVTKLWEVETAGKCWNPQILTIWTIMSGSMSQVNVQGLIQVSHERSFTGYSAFLDISFAAIPVSVIWALQMPIHKKVSLSLILGVGIL